MPSTAGRNPRVPPTAVESLPVTGDQSAPTRPGT
jgi:hypothetical protein